jgi:predicted phage baseplate assembly protein
MARTITIPEFDFAAGFYFADILELLITHLRDNVPEISNESEGELAIQLMAAYALVGHLNNVLVDLVGHESLMVTSQLRDSLVAHLKLIGFEVPGDIPAEVLMVLTLSKSFTTTEEVIPDNALFGTRRKSFAEPRTYEADAALTITRTDRLGQVWVYDASADTYVDRTTEANTDASTFAALPATPAAGDMLILGHPEVMFDRIRAGTISTPMVGVFGVWEFSDTATEDDFPDSVTNLGSTLELVIDSMLDDDGTTDFSGLEVVVTLNSTGATETLTSTYSGGANKVTTTGFLGQTTPSTDAADYTVGAQWHRVPGLDDGTNDGTTSFEIDGDVDWTLPKDLTRDWQPLAVNLVTAFYVRFRVISVTTPTAPILDRLHMDKRGTYVQVQATQGRTRTLETLGSSDGSASQEFTLAVANVIPGTVQVFVDALEWVEVDNFLSSTSVDEHFTVEVDSDGIGTITFGDGTNGKVPPAGVNNVTSTYRTDAELDGNVGANTITVNRTGVAFVKATTNPRPASQWVARRGSTATDRELLKVEGPASLRTLERAVTADDVEFLTVQFTAADGSSPFVRALAIEEGFGDKTVKCVTVGPAGAATSVSDRAELELYFNGNPATGESGVMVANQRVFARDYVAVPIDVTATITGGVLASIDTALRGLLTPVSLLDDGITFRWGFGDDVTVSKLIATIFAAHPDVTDVAITVPAANVVLDEDELPTVGTLTLTVI